SGPEQEPRRLAGPAARARVGLRAARRNPVGRRPRRTAPRQAWRSGPPDRDRRRPWIPFRRLIQSSARRSRMAEPTQNYQNPARRTPFFQTAATAILALNFFNTIRLL